jgi:hypothetical protein
VGCYAGLTQDKKVNGVTKHFRKLQIRYLQYLAFFASLAAISYITFQNFSTLSDEFKKLTLMQIFGASLVSISISIVGGFCWKPFLIDRITPTNILRINSTGQLTKYLPGSVWSYTSQAAHSKALGVSGRAMLLAMLLATLVSAVSGLTLGPFIAGELDNELASNILQFGPLSCFLLIPKSLKAIIFIICKLLKFDQNSIQISVKTILQSLTACLSIWVLFGIQISIISRDGSRIFTYTAMAATAVTLSLFFFLFPAGLGIRELLFVWILTPQMSLAQAGTIAIFSRLLIMLSDALVFVGVRSVNRPKDRSF